MKRYKSFLITEKLNQIQLLLEGGLQYSPRFTTKLEDISKKSKLAQFILNLEDDDYDDNQLTQNYIDTTEKEDSITFISQDRVNKSAGSDPFTMKGRTETRVGRLIRGLCSLSGRTTTDKEIEDFVNLYKSKSATGGEKWKLVKGDKIQYWYNEENYYSETGSGSLGKSCMASEDCQGFFDIYTDSPSCQLLILLREDEEGEEKLIGRALVWKLVKRSLSTELKTIEYFMDRIYCMKDSDEQKFKNFADEKGWLRKRGNNSNDETGMIFLLNNSQVKSRIEVNVKGDCDEYPYMDTLKFLSASKDKLSNIGFHDGFVLEDTDGSCYQCDTCDGSGYSECPLCYGNEEVECPDCYGVGTKDCDVCDGDGSRECESCEGRGSKDCESCEGNGEINGKICKKCKGSGEVNCAECKGGGSIECVKCQGRGTDDCDRCSGSGYSECPECKGGTSRPLCDACTGLIKNV